MNKTEAIATVLDVAQAAPTVFTTGYAARIGASIADRPGHFYMTGSMGLALPLGVGVALTAKVPTVVVDGDGSVLMNPAGLLAAGQYPDLPLVQVVLDDGQYASTGGQQTGAESVDLEGWARSSGFRAVTTVQDTAELRKHMEVFLADCRSPAFLRCVLSSPDLPPPPRIEAPLGGHARRFGAYVTAAAGRRPSGARAVAPNS